MFIDLFQLSLEFLRCRRQCFLPQLLEAHSWEQVLYLGRSLLELLQCQQRLLRQLL
jgi:hypothetical protein